MAMMTGRWYRSRRNVVLACIAVSLCLLYYISLQLAVQSEPDLDLTRRSAIIEAPVFVAGFRLGPALENIYGYFFGLHFVQWEERTYIENKLEEALKLDKGTGCEIPKLDPFSKEVTQFDKKLPAVVCHGQDWVKCYHSKCRVVDAILSTTTDISCEYRDILYRSDMSYTIGAATKVAGRARYALRDSDHVKVKCTGRQGVSKVEWSGNTLGFRPVPVPAPAPDRKRYDVVIFGFDTTARNGFIRRMPKSWKTLKEIGAVVMEGYNIVGDGTPAALFPILTGKTELELPDVRRSRSNDATLDSFPFLFYTMKQDGYRTAYFEDMPNIGTFQYRFNGFKRQPADHYLRAFYQEVAKSKSWWKGKKDEYCVGDTPQFKLMINITQQFLELDGNKFIFTFIADITHDDFNMIESADEDTARFLRGVAAGGDDTLLVVMGDHGPRYANVRDTLQGKLEERLPLLAVRLPPRLLRSRAGAARALALNAHALTTPHDVHATILDVLDMRERWNPYTVRGAELTRGLTMLDPIPRNRSCSEAGIEPHWCACLAWQNVSTDDPLYTRTAEALISYINSLFHDVRSLCVNRTLTSIEWVLRQRANSRLLAFANAKDVDGYVGRFNAKTAIANENYQIKIVVGPGRGVYEASLAHAVREDRFLINTRDISRTNAYRDEPSCISATHPHLNPYCYCR